MITVFCFDGDGDLFIGFDVLHLNPGLVEELDLVGVAALALDDPVVLVSLEDQVAVDCPLTREHFREKFPVQQHPAVGDRDRDHLSPVVTAEGCVVAALDGAAVVSVDQRVVSGADVTEVMIRDVCIEGYDFLEVDSTDAYFVFGFDAAAVVSGDLYVDWGHAYQGRTFCPLTTQYAIQSLYLYLTCLS